MVRNRRLALLSVFFTFFVDNLCWSIVFPIFAPYFLDPANRLFSFETSLETRTTVLGFFLMAFSLGQFFGSPLLGEYGDRHGRKRALCIGILMTLVGLSVSAWSMQKGNLTLLFLSRFATGAFAGNMSICLACISDLSLNERTKVKKFGTMSVIGGISFVVGAFMGGQLSDHFLNPWFTPQFPLYVAAGLTALNYLFVLFGFRETTKVDRSATFDILEGIRNIKEALKTEKIKRTYTIYFLFLFAWTILLQFFPVLMVRKFFFTNSELGDLAIFMGICWAIGSSGLSRILLRFFTSLHILEVCLLVFTLLCVGVVWMKPLFGVLGVLGAALMIGGLAWPLCTGLISGLAPREFQGKIMGMSQSVQSLAMALAPAIGGVAYQGSAGLPFLIAAGASLLAGIIYFTLKDHIGYD